MALVRVPFYFINLWLIPDRQSYCTLQSHSHIHTHTQVMETGAQLHVVDVDESPDLTTLYGASQLPLFVFLKRGKKIDSLVGAQNTALRKKVLKLAAA
jgi:thioredoxin-like negative regulator of GroEL